MDSKNDPTTLRNVAYICGIDDACRYSPARVAALFGAKDLSGVKEDNVYGSTQAGTGRVIHYVPVQHNMEYITSESIGHIIDWVQKTVPPPKYIDATDQVWTWRFVGTTIALVGTIFFMFPLGALLLRSSFFKSLVGPVPEFKGARGRAWWIGAILTAAIPVLTLFQVHAATISLIRPNVLWPMDRITGIMGWAVFNGVVTVILLLANHFLLKGDAGASGANYGLTSVGRGMDWGNIGKSILLAVCVIGGAYLLVAFVYWWLMIDFRIWTVFLRPLTPLRFGIALAYVIPFFLFFLALGASIHGLLRAKGGTWGIGREMLVNVIVLAPWFLLLQIAYYGPLMFGYVGVPFSGGQMRHFITAIPALMTAVACISTYFFYKTGRIYLGAAINALLTVWYLIPGNMINIPY